MLRHELMTSIQEYHVELLLTVVDEGIVGPELVLQAFGVNSKYKRGLILQGYRCNIRTSCYTLDQFVQYYLNLHPTSTGDRSLVLCFKDLFAG